MDFVSAKAFIDRAAMKKEKNTGEASDLGEEILSEFPFSFPYTLFFCRLFKIFLSKYSTAFSEFLGWI